MPCRTVADAGAAAGAAARRADHARSGASASAAAAEAEARKNGWAMAIAIAEPSGALVYFLKMDNTQYGSIKIAQAKAETAAQFRRPTKMFTDALADGHLFFLTFPGISAAPGGLPLVADGKLIGAIGVSGGAAIRTTWWRRPARRR